MPVRLKQEYGGFKQSWQVYQEATYEDKKNIYNIALNTAKYTSLARSIKNTQSRMNELKLKYKKNLMILKKYNAVEMKIQNL